MITLVSGGAGSGKSAFAEHLAVASSSSRVYLATMRVWGEEDRLRVQRHRDMRKNKGFLTIECPEQIRPDPEMRDAVVLLEDLSNLLANECFGKMGFLNVEERILSGVLSIESDCAELIIVTNELFSDGVSYPKETQDYLRILGRLNCKLAQEAERVVELVAGCPIWWKGSEL